MSYSTSLFCTINFNRETYNSKYEVLDDLEEVEKGIEYSKKVLRDLAVITEPNKYFEEDDYSNAYTWVTNECENAIESLEELLVKQYKLQLLLDNWNYCHTKDGNPIINPEYIHYDTAYINGDFIKSKE